MEGLYCFKAWRCPTLTWGSPTLPSALSIFTSEFGMGSGGSYSLLSPSKLAHIAIVTEINQQTITVNLEKHVFTLILVKLLRSNNNSK